MARRRRGMFGSSRSAAQYSEQETLDGATSQGARRDGERRERSVGTHPHRESLTPPIPPLTRRRCARSIVERLFAMRSHCIIVANSGTSESCCSDQLTVGLFVRKRCSQTLPSGGRTRAFICTAGRSTRSTTGRRSH